MNDEHQLTTWGKILETTLQVSGSTKDEEEGAFLAVELLRLGLLTADTMFPGYSGAPKRGSGEPFFIPDLWHVELTRKQKLTSVTVCLFLEPLVWVSFAISLEATVVP